MDTQAVSQSALLCRLPTAEDGPSLHHLIQQCPPLDTNSRYCNLLQCTYFARTSAIAELDGDVVGAVSGFIPPDRLDTLFIWQVAVHEQARGRRLAQQLITHILGRASSQGVRFIETTITADNGASWAMFEKLAASLNATLSSEDLFDCERHFAGHHSSETLVRIGPFIL
ncbi:diaminobutyrate acetyltransferase [Oceanicoccus sp. KOV_DT_Chl]|uniref:diaminobutyrate acetyltransferase n=1 Tax=Oceanicoccus sp. KOV_DT_Chl TaxID=1904639 RepID=UPI000C7979EE|nr:diaminobutyrate acetyltransferase [Oceanicoccus sp. KOV_DT_Chl]